MAPGHGISNQASKICSLSDVPTPGERQHPAGLTERSLGVSTAPAAHCRPRQHRYVSFTHYGIASHSSKQPKNWVQNFFLLLCLDAAPTAQRTSL